LNRKIYKKNGPEENINLINNIKKKE